MIQNSSNDFGRASPLSSKNQGDMGMIETSKVIKENKDAEYPPEYQTPTTNSTGANPMVLPFEVVVG